MASVTGVIFSVIAADPIQTSAVNPILAKAIISCDVGLTVCWLFAKHKLFFFQVCNPCFLKKVFYGAALHNMMIPDTLGHVFTALFPQD